MIEVPTKTKVMPDKLRKHGKPTLESAVSRLDEESKPFLAPAATRPVEPGLSTAGVCAETKGGYS